VLVALAASIAHATNWLVADADVNRSFANGQIDIVAYVDVPVDANLAFETLTDYNRLAEFVPNLRFSRIVGRQGELTRVRQLGQNPWMVVGAPLDVVLGMRELPPHTIRFEMLAGNLDGMAGEWSIIDIDKGVRIAYRARILPGLLSPRLPGDRFVIKADIERMLTAVGREMTRRSGEKAR
jgi:hypothetical protein